MRLTILLGSTILLLGTTAPVHADESASAIADKAIQAMGGARLAQAHAASWKASGTATINGEEVSFQADWTIQGDSQTHIDARAEANGSTINVWIVLNGNKGWASLSGVQEEMDKERLGEEHERAYLEWLTTLVPLHDKALKLTVLPAAKVAGHAAVGLKVERKDRRPVQLYFDKDRGVLLKAHMQVKDLLSGSDAEQDIYFQDYQKQDGVPHAAKVVFKRDGNPYLDMKIRDFKLEKKAPEKLFEKP